MNALELVQALESQKSIPEKHETEDGPQFKFRDTTPNYN